MRLSFNPRTQRYEVTDQFTLIAFEEGYKAGHKEGYEKGRREMEKEIKEALDELAT